MADIKSTLSFQDRMSSVINSISRRLEDASTSADLARAHLQDLERAQRSYSDAVKTAIQVHGANSTQASQAINAYEKASKEYDKGAATLEKYNKQVIAAELQMKNAENQLRQYNDEANNTNNQNKKMQQGFESMSGKIVTLSATFQLLNQAKAIIQGINNKINEYVEYTRVQMQAEDQLAIITKQRMALNDAQVRSLYDLAAAQQKVGVVGDEATIAGMTGLAAFTKQKSAIEALTPALDDLAVKMYGYNVTAENMDMISKSLGKAMLGDVGALSRMGVKIDDVTKKRLVSLKEEERAIELAKIIKNVTGDMNEEMAKTPFGQMAQASNRLGDSYEKLGAALLPLQANSVQVWSSIVETIANHLDYIVPLVTIALGAISTAFIAMKWEAITAWAAAAAPVAGVILAIGAISGVLKLLGVDFNTQGKAIMNVFFMIGNVVQDIGIVIANFFRSIYNGAVNVINLKNRITGQPLLEKKQYTELKTWKDATQTTEKISKSFKGGALTGRNLLGQTGSKNSLDGLTTNTSGGKALKTQNQGKVELSDDNMELMHDLATQKFAQYFQQLTPNLTIPSMVIHETADVNQVIGAVANAITGSVSSSTSGGFATA